MTNSALAGRITMPVIDRTTFGLKGTVLRVGCSTRAAGIRLPAEGYYQFAFAYRIKP
jgi:hypothetical protein